MYSSYRFPVLLVGIAALSFFLTGCADSPPWGSWSKAPTPAQYAAAMGRPETFIYFSRYEIYRHDPSGLYVYQDGRGWVSRTVLPATVSEGTLLASPSVKLTFTHGGPEKEHDLVKRTYPREWHAGGTIIAATH